MSQAQPTSLCVRLTAYAVSVASIVISVSPALCRNMDMLREVTSLEETGLEPFCAGDVDQGNG